MAQMQAPPREIPSNDNGYFEVLTKSVFQTGLSWAVVNNKWPGFTEAFDGFDIDTVADFGPDDEERLVVDTRIVRNGRKIAATIANARKMQELIAQHGSMGEWLGTTENLPWPDRKAAVAKEFSNFGPLGAYIFLWSVGEAVPEHELESSWTTAVPLDGSLRH